MRELSIAFLLFGCSPGHPSGTAPYGTETGGTGQGGNGGSATVPGNGGTTLVPPPPGGSGPCRNLECRVEACSGAARTTVSGVVTTPAGTLPLYNVMVYVPNGPLAPIAEGASCDVCGSVSGEPVAAALSDTRGQFVLYDVPSGENVPLVLQVGKWRREVTIPNVEPCVDNPLGDPELTRLPRNRSEGHIPKIALATGGLDALECLVRKLGIADSEFTNPDGDGRVNLFAGRAGTDRYDVGLNSGGRFPFTWLGLWGAESNLSAYDMVLLACEGAEYPTDKMEADRQRIFDYANTSGRMFFSHWHKYWLDHGPAPFPDVMSFNDTEDDLDITASVETSFPKGRALAEWLVNVGASLESGKVPLIDAQNTAAAENPDYAQRWIYDPLDPFTMASSVKYVTANTPIGAAAEDHCGRIVYSDIHVATGLDGSDESAVGLPFPTGCHSTELTPQEKVLIFMLFDLSACLIPDDVPPEPPPVVR